MKKRIISIMLILAFVLLAMPFAGVSAADTQPWTPVEGTSTATATGFTSAAATSERWLKYGATLYEGKISANIGTNIFAASDESGFVIGSNGLKTGSGLFVFFSGDKICLGEFKNGAWTTGGLEDANLGEVLGTEAWTAAKAASAVKLSVAFSQKGAIRVWVNDVPVLDYEGATIYGGELGFRTGDENVDVTVTNFAIEGGLTLKVVQGNATYDAKTYTLTTQDGATLAYFSNRDIRNGSIKSTFPVVNNNDGQSGVLIGLYDNGSDAREGVNIAYYMLQLRGTNQFRWCMSDGAEATEEMLALPKADRTNAMNAYIDSRITGYDFSANDGSPCYWFFGGNKAITDLNNIVASFNIGATSAVIDSSAINASVGSFTDPKPFDGGFYGIRSDKGTTVSVYAINNEAEAIGLDIDAGDLDLSNLDQGQTYTVKVSTFPANAVINSGDTITLSGNGIRQVGNATKNNDGTYTVKFQPTKDGEVTLSAEVDNHIFGTLKASADLSVNLVEGYIPPTGDATTTLVGAGLVLCAILGCAVVIERKRAAI